jgi:hypothetical protein
MRIAKKYIPGSILRKPASVPVRKMIWEPLCISMHRQMAVIQRRPGDNKNYVARDLIENYWMGHNAVG